FNVPTLQSMGMFNIDGVKLTPKADAPLGAFARLCEKSKGKDTTIGHWEIAGVESPTALPVFPNGFPSDLIDAFKAKTGCEVLCNKPYSGTDVLRDYGEEHMRTGALIVYTSADSVFQVAAHESVVPYQKLYEYCEAARELLTGKYGVGRVIARPFAGENPENFKRTTNRHDISLKPPRKTMLDAIKAAGLASIGVGKIYDIFAGEGVSEKIKTTGNVNGMEETIRLAKSDFH
ncbi:MAG: phosphopentomutase, partial [Oscillospiraceae bacterium]